MPHPTLCPAGETGASTSRLGAEVHTNGPQLDDRILADADVQVGWLSRAASGCTCRHHAMQLLHSRGMCAPLLSCSTAVPSGHPFTPCSVRLPLAACAASPAMPHLLIPSSAFTCDRLQACIANASSASKEYEIVNVDRSALGRVGGAIARKYGDSGFTGTLTVSLAVMPPQGEGQSLDRRVDGSACSTNALPLPASLPASLSSCCPLLHLLAHLPTCSHTPPPRLPFLCSSTCAALRASPLPASWSTAWWCAWWARPTTTWARAWPAAT